MQQVVMEVLMIEIEVVKQLIKGREGAALSV